MNQQATTSGRFEPSGLLWPACPLPRSYGKQQQAATFYTNDEILAALTPVPGLV
jgi:hypothetical protein